MKRIVAILTIIMLVLTFHTVIYAEPYENTSINVGSTFKCYHVGSMDFLVPGYYSLDPIVVDNTVSIIDDIYGAVFKVANIYVEPQAVYKMVQYPKLVVEEIFRKAGTETFSTSKIGLTETVTARGYTCYLTTSVTDDKQHILKMAAFYNSSTTEIYMMCLMYANALEGTDFANDFYKFLYDDPYAYDPATAPQYVAPAQTQPSQSSSEWQELRDYIGLMDNYVDTMETLDNTDNFGEALGSIANFYGNVAAYGQKYGY